MRRPWPSLAPSPRPLIHARGLTKRFGVFTAVDGDRLRRRDGRELRLPGTQRRRQDQHDAHDRVRVAGVRGHAPDPGPRPRARRAADPRAPGRGAPAGHPRHGAVGSRQPGDLRAVLRADAGRERPPRRRAPGVRAALGARERQGRTALGGHEAAPDDRPRPHQRAVDPAARRAHDRPRPAGPPPALGASLPAQAAGRDACPDDPLHGRGRAAVRPARGHGQGPDRRRGLAAPAHRGVRDPRGHRDALSRRCPGDPRGPAGRSRRAHRAPPRPGPRLLRRRRGGRGRRPPARSRCRRPSWSGGARWRTCSCG